MMRSSNRSSYSWLVEASNDDEHDEEIGLIAMPSRTIDNNNLLPVQCQPRRRQVLSAEHSTMTTASIYQALYQTRLRDSKLILPNVIPEPSSQESPCLLLLNKETSNCLGQGGFCSVHASSESSSSAIKFLSESTLQSSNKQRLWNGAMDLMYEGYILSALNHKHIIRLKSMTLPSTRTTSLEQFALVLERMDRGTLQDCIIMNSTTTTTATTTTDDVSILQRLTWAWQLSQALEYMHSKRLIHRDLKLDNVGVVTDITSNDSTTNSSSSSTIVKLLDFGLAKELIVQKEEEESPSKSNNNNNLHTNYRLSSHAGSFPLQAPEVVLGHEYNEKVDVYSFALLVWSLFTGKEAFSNVHTQADFVQRICINHERPTFDHDPCWNATTNNDELKNLLSACWHPTPSLRPTMAHVQETLEQLVNDMQTIHNHEHFGKTQAMQSALLLLLLLIVTFGTFLIWIYNNNTSSIIIILSTNN